MPLARYESAMTDSWLFVKPDAAVRIVRRGSLTFDVHGPGSAVEQRHFSADTDAVAFLQRAQEELVGSGFRFKGFEAERRERDERREERRDEDRRAR